MSQSNEVCSALLRALIGLDLLPLLREKSVPTKDYQARVWHQESHW
jgi:hypothetical protein